MGLDMMLKKMARVKYSSVDIEDLWKIEGDNSDDLMCWRKEYDLHFWFFNNIKISIYEVSEEISNEKLKLLINWLTINDFIDYAFKIKEIIDSTDFKNEVIYYRFYP
jgi:uncharacterized membrane protein YpjA